MDGSRPGPLSDESLDRALDAAFDVDPSPEFVARVRTRIAAEPTPRIGWGWHLAVWMSWATAAALVVAVSIAVSSMMNRASPAPAVRTEMPRAPQEDVAAGLQAGRPALSAQPRTNGRSVARGEMTLELPRAVAVDGAPFDDVLVSTAERRAFDRLVAAAEQGRLPSFVEQGDPENPFGIQPIEIEPLTLTDLTIGPAAEGEDRP